MDRYQETFETWDKVAGIYQDKFMNLALYDFTYDFICDTIKKEKAKLLEIGCGPGNITKYLLSKRPALDIFGIDIAPNMISLAKKNNPAANFEVMDSRDIDKLATKYHGVICGFCLPYLSNKECEKLIFNCANLLYDGGLVYLSFVEGSPDNSGFQTGSSGGRVYFYFHTLENLVQQLVNNNFEGVNTFKVAYKKSESESEIHTILIATKKEL